MTLPREQDLDPERATTVRAAIYRATCIGLKVRVKHTIPAAPGFAEVNVHAVACRPSTSRPVPVCRSEAS
jgi:hypothetical protein